MPLSPILQIPVLTESMAQKTLAVNMAIQSMEAAIAGKLEIDTSEATSFLFDVVIPFEAINDLSSRMALRAIFYEVMPGATDEFYLTHPQAQHLFIIKNSSAHPARLRTLGIGWSSLSVPPGAVYLVFCDGVQMHKMEFTLEELSQAYDFECSFWGQPGDSEVIARARLGRGMILLADLPGSWCRVTVPPVTTRTLSIRSNDIQIGTISIAATTGTATFTKSGDSSLLPQTVLTIVNQAGSPDPQLDGIEIVLLGRTVVTQPFP